MSCRLCGGVFYNNPLVTLHKAPSGAQSFLLSPSEEDQATQLEVVECSCCGLVQLPGEPVPYYKQVITAADLSMEMRQFRTKQIKDWVDSNALHGKSILEIGSGKGNMLSILANAGVLAEGLEYMLPNKEVLVNGGILRKGYPETGFHLQHTYDGFVCFNFIEHAPFPVDFLRSVHNMLHPDAVGLVEVPCLEHIIETKRAYDWVADHLSYFTCETLTIALSISGFDVLNISRDWKGYSLVASVRRKKPLDLSSLNEALNELLHHLQGWATDSFEKGRRIAVWGASHQALTLLSCSEFHQAVSYVIDSAPFKQGRFTPVNKVPIVSPDVLLNDKSIDDILVAAAGFSDEVVGILKEQYSYTGGILILRGNNLERIQHPLNEKRQLIPNN